MKLITKYSRVYQAEMIFMIELNSKPKSFVQTPGLVLVVHEPEDSLTCLFPTIDFGLELNLIIKNHFSLINSTIFSHYLHV